MTQMSQMLLKDWSKVIRKYFLYIHIFLIFLIQFNSIQHFSNSISAQSARALIILPISYSQILSMFPDFRKLMINIPIFGARDNGFFLT